MKKLILLELILLFLATTFKSDRSPGWVQQTLPRSDVIVQDIFFLDSLTGWAAAQNYPANDTGLVFKTTNGGINWFQQFNAGSPFGVIFTSIQFTDQNTGYLVGSNGFGKVWKTSDGGTNWNIIANFSANPIRDLSFSNNNTGWICSEDFTNGGIFKTTNGGTNWQIELTASSEPSKLFFLNKDTGWAICQTTKLLRTIDGGNNWIQQFVLAGGIGDIHFFNAFTGIISSGRFYRTTDGGFNWTQSLSMISGGNLSFGSNLVGWAGYNLIYIPKTTDGGITWFLQTTNLNNPAVSATDSLKAWAGGNGIVHTTDGGGPPVGIQQIGNEIPSEYKLYQNYPNPFNPSTVISYQLRVNSYTKLTVYDVTGKYITDLVNQKQNAGTYQVDFDGSKLSSGVYFYRIAIHSDKLIIGDRKADYSDTKKMLMIK